MALRIGLAAITACTLAMVALAGNGRARQAIDPTFGTGGRVGIAFAGSDAQAYAAAVQADGKILLAGDVSEQPPPPPPRRRGRRFRLVPRPTRATSWRSA